MCIGNGCRERSIVELSGIKLGRDVGDFTSLILVRIVNSVSPIEFKKKMSFKAEF